ncbi:MAG: hypothetical protein ACE5LQ_02625, partial [Candidatus Bipolaricaulia bacterium]
MQKRITLLTVVALLLGLFVIALPGTALQIDDGSDQPLASQSQGQSMGEGSALAGTLLQVLADRLGIGIDQLRQAIRATVEEMGLRAQSAGQRRQAPARAEGELSGPFLKALADRLGISVEQLKQAVQAVREEMGKQARVPGQGRYHALAQRPGYRYQAQGELPSLFLQVLADKLVISVDQLKNALNATKDEVIQRRLREAVQAGRITPERAQALQQRLSQAEPRELLKLMLRHREARGLVGRQVPFGKELKRGWLIGPRWQPPQHYLPPS